MSSHWMCEFCGREVMSSSMPASSRCPEAPFGGTSHSWIEVDGHTYQWRCAYCGKGVNGSMPKPGNSCSKNSFGKKFHKWVQS